MTFCDSLYFALKCLWQYLKSQIKYFFAVPHKNSAFCFLYPLASNGEKVDSNYQNNYISHSKCSWWHLKTLNMWPKFLIFCVYCIRIQHLLFCTQCELENFFRGTPSEITICMLKSVCTKFGALDRSVTKKSLTDQTNSPLCVVSD